MPGDLTAYRTALAANLAPLITDTPQLLISAYVVANPDPPVIWVRPSPDILIEYHQAMRDGAEFWHLMIQAYAGAYADVEAQQILDSWISPTAPQSVKAAVEDDRTLGGSCQDLHVLECRNYSEFLRADGSTLIGAEWAVDVLA